MSEYSLTFRDLRAASGFGYRRLTRLLLADPPIPFQKVSGLKGGHPKYMYRLADALPRLLSHTRFIAENAIALTKIDQLNRGVIPNVTK
ncbi:MAG: hypothetical protein ACK4VZ_10635 [Paracoccaceae bacterium]